MSQPVPMSGEVLAHHLDLHPCDADMESVRCPCGDTVAFVCRSCREVVVAASRVGTWCQHAAELWEAHA